jgi:hypothetical protein
MLLCILSLLIIKWKAITTFGKSETGLLMPLTNLIFFALNPALFVVTVTIFDALLNFRDELIA